MEHVNGWGAALRAIRSLAGISGQQLGNEVGLTRAAISLYENDDRRPDAHNVRALNSAIARLARLPEASDYLNALAFLDDLLVPSRGDFASEAVLRLILDFGDYFEGGTDALVQAWGKLNDERRLRVVIALATIRGEELKKRLEGRPERAFPLVAILTVFDKAGAPLYDALRLDERLVRRVIRDRFESLVGAELAKMSAVKAEARFAAMARILQHFDEALDDALSPEMVAALFQKQRRHPLRIAMRNFTPKVSEPRPRRKARKP